MFVRSALFRTRVFAGVVLLGVTMALGLAGGVPSNATAQVAGLRSVGVKAISAGNEYTCALFSDGTVKCWGLNNSGQLGSGKRKESFRPVPVSGITDAIQISAGNDHTCALLSDHTVKCWGAGPLGNGKKKKSLTPVAVTGIENATEISAGSGYTCAVLSIRHGRVKCWGDNAEGALGDGKTKNSLRPVLVNVGREPTQVSARNNHTCVRFYGLGAERVKCWGDNEYDQLGNGKTQNSLIPVSVRAITHVAQVSAGAYHTCALLDTGTVECWGDNEYGQLGNGTTANSLGSVSVSGITNAIQISAGAWHTCARLTTGEVECWGENDQGELGDGTATNSSTPAPVSGITNGITNAIQVSAGSNHTCALLSTGAVECWGNDDAGQLGNGNTSGSVIPVSVIGLG